MEFTPTLPISRGRIAALLVCTILTGPLAALDWDQFHGPNRNLVSTESGWRTDWSSSGPKVLWKKEVGIGFSSVAVSAGRAYTIGHRGGNETVFSIDVESGDEVWKHTYKCALVDYLHEGGSASTPTVDGEHLYTLSREGRLFCFKKATGEIVWDRELQQMLSVPLPDWGFCSSPLVRGNQLLLDTGATVAIDKTRGDLVWSTQNYHSGYGSPIFFKHSGREYVSVLNNDAAILIDPNAGKVLAEYTWRTSYATNGTTPIAHDGTLFISTGYDKGCALLEIRNGTLRELYSNKDMRNQLNNCVLFRGYLYGFDRNSSPRRLVNLKCMEYRSGRVRWKKTGFGSGGIMIADGKLIILGDQGTLAIAEATPKRFKLLSKKKVLSGRCWTVPVLSNGRIYCRDSKGSMVCLDVRK